MWAITNSTPFAAERAWVRDKNGAEVWLVAVRGTFSINPDGSMQPAEEQLPVSLAPEYRGDPASSSLLYDTDLNHKKLATDVILHGHAYAPKGEPATEVEVSLKVANIDKSLVVIGDRVFENGLLGIKMTKPEPFTKMPLEYERAYGGTDKESEDPDEHSWEIRNPVGRGFAVRSQHLLDKPAPNVENPNAPYGFGNRKPEPAGFGPIPGHWPQRVKYAGTYDEKWEKEKQPLLPDDFDERFFQCAPHDQQVPGYLKGGEVIQLRNLTTSGFLEFRLPKVSIRFETEFDDADSEVHRGVLHTVILEPDFPRVMMIWHTHLPCHHKVLKLVDTEISLLERINVPDDDRAAEVWTG